MLDALMLCRVCDCFDWEFCDSELLSSLFSESSGLSGSGPSGSSAGGRSGDPGGSILNPGGQKEIPKKEGQPPPPDGGLMGPPKPGGAILPPRVGMEGGWMRAVPPLPIITEP